MNRIIVPVIGLLLLTGAGCIDLPEQFLAEDIDLAADATIHLEQKGFSLLPGANKGPYWEIKIENVVAGEELNGSWNKFEERETAESIAAREAAERSGIGDEAVETPDPIYEMIGTGGSLATRALDEATAASLPTLWSANKEHDGGERNSLIWLSKKQYNELVTTRHTHLELDVLGLGVGGLLDAAGSLKDIVENFSGGDIPEVKIEDLTEIEAAPEWGTYSVQVDGDTKKLQVIEAHNRFASYVILANPDNPIILEIKLEVFGINTGLLSSFSNLPDLNGYHVTELNGFKSIVPTNENQPEPQVQ